MALTPTLRYWREIDARTWQDTENPPLRWVPDGTRGADRHGGLTPDGGRPLPDLVRSRAGVEGRATRARACRTWNVR